MPNEEKISQLNAVVTALLTDILPDVQAAEVNVQTRKITLQQIRDLLQQNLNNVNISGGQATNLAQIQAKYGEISDTINNYVTSYVLNNSNTSNAGALLALLVAGETAKNAILQLGILNGDLFNIYFDNADANSLKIDNDSTVLLRMARTGEITLASSILATILKLKGTNGVGANTLTIQAGSTLTSDRFLQIFTGDNSRAIDISAANFTLSSFGATLVDDADAATARATLGLGTAALLASSAVLQSANNLSDLASVLTALRNLMGTSINSQSGTTYTAAAATDAYRKTLFTNASGCTVTINDSSFGVGDEAFYQRGDGAGTITFVAGSGVTLYSSPTNSFKIADPSVTGGVWLFKAATNYYYIRGDLTP